MHYELRFLPEKNLVIGSASGDPTPKEMIAMAEGKYRHPNWRPGMSTLVDLRELHISKMNAKDLEQFQKLTSNLIQELGFEAIGRTQDATVVSRSVDYGIVRQWETPMGDDVPFEHRVFLSYTEAMDWLGISEL